MKPDEKVMSEWPKELRDEAQPLEELPLIGNTDYLIVRFQGEKNQVYMAQVADTLQDLTVTHGDAVGVSYTSISQGHTRWQPKNSWAVARGLFDWLMSYGREVMQAEEQQVRAKQTHRDERRRERAAR